MVSSDSRGICTSQGKKRSQSRYLPPDARVELEVSPYPRKRPHRGLPKFSLFRVGDDRLGCCQVKTLSPHASALTSVDWENNAGYEAGLVRMEEEAGVGDVPRRAHLRAQGHCPVSSLPQLRP